MSTQTIASGATESSLISVAAGSVIQVFASRPLAMNESVVLQRSPDSGTNWDDVGVAIDSENPSALIAGPGDFRLQKNGITSSSATLVIYRDE